MHQKRGRPLHMYLQIFIHSFNIYDIINPHPDISVVDLQIDDIGSIRRNRRALIKKAELLVQIARRALKILEPIRFQQIVHSSDLVAVYRIIRISCRKDDKRRIGQRPYEFQTLTSGILISTNMAST